MRPDLRDAKSLRMHEQRLDYSSGTVSLPLLESERKSKSLSKFTFAQTGFLA
jgi:hypothetical protein